MKLLYLVPSINNEGGVARVLAKKANYLVEKLGYEIHILTQNNGNSPLFYSFNTEIVLHDMILQGNKIKFFLNYKKQLKKYIQEINPDIIIVADNGLKAYFVPMLLGDNIPIVFECHGSKFIEEKENSSPYLTRIKLLFKQFSAQRFNRFVALSKNSLEEWNVENGIVISNPLWFEPSKFATLKSKKVIAVGRYAYEKGFDRLINIWSKIILKYPDWTLEIYGKSDRNQELEQLANSLNITRSVSFFEPVENIIDRYVESSIMVMTSRTEGFGMVLIEAMTLGVPCIAYDCPCGPRAIITNNENGFLIEDDDSNSFIQKLGLLMEDEDLRGQMGMNAQKSVKKYNLDAIMLQWKSLFEEMKKQ